MTTNKRVRIFQIYYDADTRRLVEPQFTPLDNSSSPRPDWAEYWPIRQVLQKQTFDEDEWIGFFSPRLREKTGMDGAAVLHAIQSRDAEVYSFSPYFEMGAVFLNPVFQGDAHHPGLVNLFEALMPELGLDLDVRTFVSDQTTSIFCNYFVARPALWKRWFELAEKVFEISERPQAPLAAQLNAKTTHREATSYAMKVFVIERLISLLLEAEGIPALPCVDFRAAPRSVQQMDGVLAHLYICDALKGHYNRTQSPVYIELYQQIRLELVDELNRIEQEANAVQGVVGAGG